MRRAEAVSASGSRVSPAPGKTTIAHLVGPELDQRGAIVEYLDGDTVRTHLSKGLGFSKEDRDTNIERIGWVASRLVRHGAAVICAAISPYEETRRKARELVEEQGPFVEVFVRASVEECARRDVKGLYEKAFAGEIKGFTGVDDPYEEPENAEIVIDTEGQSPEESAQAVIAKLEEIGSRAGGGERVSTVTTDQLIKPHGGELVERTGERPDDVESLETVRLSPRELADLDMLASGALSPLTGFMSSADYERVVEDMRLASGLPWALPVCLAVENEPSGDRIALADESGRPLAVLEVEEVYGYDKEREAERCFRTTDDAHPGVARLYGQPDHYVAGPGDGVRALRAGLPRAAQGSARDAGALRRARLEARRRVPDPQPDPPGARVPDQVRARDRRRAPHPPARRRDEVGRRARPRRG